jgi:hypothetical protein
MHKIKLFAFAAAVVLAGAAGWIATTRFAKRRSDAAGKSLRSHAEPPSRLLCRARGGVLRPGLPRCAREKWTQFAPAPLESAKGRGEESRFRAVCRYPGSFDGLTVRAAGRRRASGQGASESLSWLPERVRARQGYPLRFEQASRASCRSLVGSGRPAERELDSQPGNRCSAARGLRWPTPAPNTRRRAG